MESRTHLNRDMDIGAIFIIGVVSVLLIVEIAIGTQTWFFSTLGEQQSQKSILVQRPAFVAANEQQKKNIAGIDEAIKAYVASQGRDSR